jgi:hypothetical protein
MHPGPMNEGVEISPDVAISGRSVITEQVANGVAVRMALLYLLAGSHQGAAMHEAGHEAAHPHDAGHAEAIR